VLFSVTKITRIYI